MSSALDTQPDDWLKRYFDNTGKITSSQLRFWIQATL
jgi:hypothetical protein